jgi:hypothetical protein
VSAVAGQLPLNTQMHLHASFSEGTGSFEAQLQNAAANGFDVLFWTDHDWRMAHAAYRTQVSFDSLHSEMQFGGPWAWTSSVSGPTITQACGLVSSPTSPNDPSPTRSALRVSVTAGSGASAAGLYANGGPSKHNYAGSIVGASMAIDAFPITASPGGYLEVLMQLSVHSATGGRRTGNYCLSYRIGPGLSAGRSMEGLIGAVTVPAPAGRWTTVSMNPMDDFAAIWPDLDARDNALCALWLRAVAPPHGSVEGVFDNLTFDWCDEVSSAAAQDSMVSELAALYPSVTQLQSLEYSSYDSVHLNGFVSRWMPEFPTELGFNVPAGYYQNIVDTLHSQGSLVSYNHPYGASSAAALSSSAQVVKRQKKAASLVASKCMRCDILEVGYQLRGGVALAEYLNLWDTLSRNRVFVVGNAVSDNHAGTASSWTSKTNRWSTFVWSQGKDQGSLLASIAAGRIYGGQVNGFTGALDLLVDGAWPMGARVSAPASSHHLQINATGLPLGGAIQVIQGVIDSASTNTPGTTTIATLPAASFAGGSSTLRFDGTNTFVRVNVLDGAGKVTGFSNPVWLTA